MPLLLARDRMVHAPRQLRFWPWLVLLVVSTGTTAVIAWQMMSAAMDLPTLRVSPPSKQPIARSMPVAQRRVRLFYPQEGGQTLKEQEREIPRRPILAEEVRAVIRELTQSMPGVRAPLPQGTEVRQVFLDTFGILYLDFNQRVPLLAAGPGAEAELTISALVNSLTASFSEAKRVQLLIDGKEISGMAGTWDLSRPMVPHFPGNENSFIPSSSQG